MYTPALSFPDSEAGPLCNTSLMKIPSRMLPQMLKPNPVKSWLRKETTFTSYG